MRIQPELNNQQPFSAGKVITAGNIIGLGNKTTRAVVRATHNLYKLGGKETVFKIAREREFGEYTDCLTVTAGKITGKVKKEAKSTIGKLFRKIFPRFEPIYEFAQNSVRSKKPAHKETIVMMAKRALEA